MSLPLAAGTWSIDPTHSVVQFAVRHLGISTLRGRFGEVDAMLSVGDDLDSTSLSAVIGLGSIDTGDPNRDGHVRSSDFFDADVNPKMTFESSSIEPGDGSAYQVTGTLTLNGTSRTETLSVSFFGTESNPLDSSLRAGFNAVGSIDRTDYGIDWNVPLQSGGLMLGKQVEISIDAQLVAQQAD